MPAAIRQDERERRMAIIEACPTKAEAARRIGISRGALSKWLNELEKPGPIRADAPDTLSKGDAEKLARRITAYWRDQGYSVACWIEQSGTSQRHKFWGVRSDLVNGLPAKLARRGV
jgi:transposase